MAVRLIPSDFVLSEEEHWTSVTGGGTAVGPSKALLQGVSQVTYSSLILSRMALSWLERRFLDNAPVAPLSSQQNAAHWEPSVQEFVREIGGYKVAELAEAVSNRWAFKFTVSKVSPRRASP